MGLYNMIDKDRISPGITPAQAQSTDFYDVVDASFQSTMDNFRVNSKTSLIEEGTTERDKKYKELTGRSIYDDALPFLMGDTRLESEKAGIPLRPGDKNVVEAVDRLLEQAGKDGRLSERLSNSQDLIKGAEDRANDSLAKQQLVAAGATRAKGIVGGLAGGFGAMFFDPLNVATLPFGAGASRSFLKTVFIEAGINAGTEAASQPFVADWQNQIGQKYGFNDMVENVGMAALFGAAIPTIGHGAKLSFEGGVHAFDTIKGTLKKYGQREAADSAEYMSRVAHLETNKTPDTGISQRFDEAFPVDSHTRAMNETNSAVLEGRSLNPEKVDTPIPKHTDDPSMKSTVEKFNELDIKDPNYKAKIGEIADEVTERLKARGQIVDEADINPIFKEEKPVAPDVEVHEKLQEVYKSPEAITAEKTLFEDIEKLPDDKPIEFDSDGEPTKTVGDYKKEIQEDNDFVNLIRTCSV